MIPGPPFDEAEALRRTKRFQATIGMVIGGILFFPSALVEVLALFGSVELLVVFALPATLGALLFFPALAKFRANRPPPSQS